MLVPLLFINHQEENIPDKTSDELLQYMIKNHPERALDLIKSLLNNNACLNKQVLHLENGRSERKAL
jgi:hypothetical protein